MKLIILIFTVFLATGALKAATGPTYLTQGDIGVIVANVLDGKLGQLETPETIVPSEVTEAKLACTLGCYSKVPGKPSICSMHDRDISKCLKLSFCTWACR